MRQRPRFRVSTRRFREATRVLARVNASRHLGVFAIGGLVAVFVAVSGGFGSHGITPELRLAVIGMAAMAIIAAAVAIRTALSSRFQLAGKPFRLSAIQVALLTPLAAVLCWAIAFLFQGDATPPVWDFLAPCLFTIAAAEGILHLFSRKRARVTPTPSQPGLASRLPPALRQSEILAVEAEDHFLRVHTSAGDALLPMRFSDALQLLGNEPGAQTHRSWWVARSAVVAVKRGNGRARLNLVNGLEVPASRQFARRLREEGWY